MVDGCQKIASSRPVPCVAVDLDGTLLRGNSLHIMLRFMAAKLRRDGRYGSLLRMVGLLGLRRLGLISHVRMKHPLHALAAGLLTESDVERLTSVLTGAVNRELTDFLAEYRRRGYKLLLATAAPDVYTRQLATVWGFDAVVATPLSARVADYAETRGERKRELCLNFAAERGWIIKAVATDHSDDLPLLSLSGIDRLLVGPAPELTDELRHRGLEFRVV